jgi:hypothetical protein
MAQDKFTEEQFIELKAFLKELRALPKDKMAYIWSSYLTVTGTRENQPCGCKSSGGLWAKAVETLNNYIKENDN